MYGPTLFGVAIIAARGFLCCEEYLVKSRAERLLSELGRRPYERCGPMCKPRWLAFVPCSALPCVTPGRLHCTSTRRGSKGVMATHPLHQLSELQ